MPNPHDGRDIDTVRGYGASPLIPVQLCAEENVLCQAADTYPNEDIFLHEFAHNMHWAMSELYGKSFDNELDALYTKAKAKAKAKKLGKEGQTYAVATVQEYFAEGVQSWLDLNDESIPANGIHNHVNTRTELRAFDRGLHDFLAQYLPEDRNNCSCHAQGT
jgi:alpha-glucosidase